MTLEMHILEREKKSLLQGRAEGIAKGSHSKAVETAINLKKKGIALDIISDATGLSLTEVQSL